MPQFSVTGGFGSGKSTALRFLLSSCRELGIPCIHFDADEEIRRVLAEDRGVWVALCRSFPAFYRVEQGALQIDRDGVRSQVLPDPEQRRRLEDILHPPVSERLSAAIDQSRQAGQVLWADVPLLYEVAWQNKFHGILLVACSPSVQKRRLAEERHLSPETIRQFLAAQWPLAEKVPMADFVLWNDGAVDSLERQSRSLCQELLGSLREDPAGVCG